MKCMLFATLMVSVPALGASGCWVELFDEPEYQGLQIRIDGPADLPTLHKVHGTDWNDLIDSLEVGPEAEAIVYLNENFEVPDAPVNHPDALKLWGNRKDSFSPSVMVFTSGHKVHHLGEYGFHNQVSSLKVLCHKAG